MSLQASCVHLGFPIKNKWEQRIALRVLQFILSLILRFLWASTALFLHRGNDVTVSQTARSSAYVPVLFHSSIIPAPFLCHTAVLSKPPWKVDREELAVLGLPSAHKGISH